ncbi:MAG: hypothetical protein JO279_02620 [Verrucomicrobia bacterium]|nr:hypothetical protein [Verrucomicrobiota bacterium]
MYSVGMRIPTGTGAFVAVPNHWPAGGTRSAGGQIAVASGTQEGSAVGTDDDYRVLSGQNLGETMVVTVAARS